ncbi:MAG: hypothetical protein HY813_03925 [Candidatus Portnoybacteria bacterium]|nr:hypothetical protein [Candidatus Portnoybacteria bacterium]
MVYLYTTTLEPILARIADLSPAAALARAAGSARTARHPPSPSLAEPSSLGGLMATRVRIVSKLFYFLFKFSDQEKIAWLFR